ncbi:uncharacterized protein LOC127862041 [Dreissena polymorpha]|nr:uncharacterized protein LOC127862041 [Dreissena polymorpha]
MRVVILIGNALIFSKIISSSHRASIQNPILFVREMSSTPVKRKQNSSGTPRKAKKAKQEDANPNNFTEDDKHVFFFGKKCVFSQFHPAYFVEGDLKFNCMEQYMHYHKAATFKDKQMQKQILASDDPLTHKKLGRKVSKFDPKVWGSVSLEVVKRGSKLKYNQNLEMKRILYGTHPKQLVEASPRDRLWGVGMGQSNPKIHDPKNWRGKNLLGEVLTGVRYEMMQADGVLDTGKVAKKNSEERITVEEEKAGQSTSVTDKNSATQNKTEKMTLEQVTPQKSPEKTKMKEQEETKQDKSSATQNKTEKETLERVTPKKSPEKTKMKEQEETKQDKSSETQTKTEKGTLERVTPKKSPEKTKMKQQEETKQDQRYTEQSKSKETQDEGKTIVKQKETDDNKSAKKRKREEKSMDRKESNESLSMKKRKLDES